MIVLAAALFPHIDKLELKSESLPKVVLEQTAYGERLSFPTVTEIYFKFASKYLFSNCIFFDRPCGRYNGEGLLFH